MMPGSTEAARWAVAAADALNRHGSWTGRIHIHKHLFITQVLNLAHPPFEYVLYDYGPYSFELDQEIVNLELFGLLSRSYPKAGYGPRYEPTPPGLALAQNLGPHKGQAVERVAQHLGDKKSQDLELIATCLWFDYKEQVRSVNDIVTHVQQIKPKYAEAAIRKGLDDARALAHSLAAQSESAA